MGREEDVVPALVERVLVFPGAPVFLAWFQKHRAVGPFSVEARFPPKPGETVGVDILVRGTHCMTEARVRVRAGDGDRTLLELVDGNGEVLRELTAWVTELTPAGTPVPKAPARPPPPSLVDGIVKLADAAALQRVRDELKSTSTIVALHAGKAPEVGPCSVRFSVGDGRAGSEVRADVLYVAGPRIVLSFADADAAMRAMEPPARVEIPEIPSTPRSVEKPASRSGIITNAEWLPHVPVFSDGELFLQDADAVRRAHDEIAQVGGIMGMALGRPPALGPTTVRFTKHGDRPSGAVGASVTVVRDQQVALVFDDVDFTVAMLKSVLGEGPVPNAPTTPQPARSRSRVGMAAVQPPPAPSAPPAPSPPVEEAPLPPAVLAESLITIPNATALKRIQDELVASSGFLVSLDPATTRPGPAQFRLAVPGAGTTGKLDAQLLIVDGKRAALLFPDRAVVLAAIDAVMKPVVPAVPASLPAASPMRTVSVDISARPFVNPETPAELLALNLAEPPDPRTVEQPSLLELIQALARLRAFGTLVIRAGGKEVRAFFQGGMLLANNDDQTRLQDVLTARRGTIAMVPRLDEEITEDRRARDARRLVGDALRTMLSALPVETLEEALEPRMHLFPEPIPDLQPARVGLKLDEKERRFLDDMAAGTRSLRNLPKISPMIRPATIRFFYVMFAYRLVVLNETGRDDGSATPEELFIADCEATIHANPYDALKLHWSEHPGAIRERGAARKAHFSSTNPLAAAHPALAAKAADAIERALQVLATKEGRATARAAFGTVDLVSAAEILVKHAELAQIRKDKPAARAALEMAIELNPSLRVVKPAAEG